MASPWQKHFLVYYVVYVIPGFLFWLNSVVLLLPIFVVYPPCHCVLFYSNNTLQEFFKAGTPLEKDTFFLFLNDSFDQDLVPKNGAEKILFRMFIEFSA